ncbi:DNA polymerase family B protein, partial [Toxoplasma gondii MAS]
RGYPHLSRVSAHSSPLVLALSFSRLRLFQVPLALNRPQELAVYSVSDAVATFFLYEKYIHNFILALCTIIPMTPEYVLRQGSGTLCEQLLMAEAAGRNVLFPNKHQHRYLQYWRDEKSKKMHLVLEDSYVGGRVESLKCG